MKRGARPLLEMRAITKRFPGVLALDRVDLAVRRGEVHLLLGENGAGKSTLMKILSGALRPDAGSIRLDGQPFAPADPLASAPRNSYHVLRSRVCGGGRAHKLRIGFGRSVS